MATTVPLYLFLHPIKPVKRQCHVCYLLESEFNLLVYCRNTEKGIVISIKSTWKNTRPAHAFTCQPCNFRKSVIQILCDFVLACHNVSHIDFYLFARLHCWQTMKNKENQNFVILNCVKKDWWCHSKSTQMIGPYWSLCPGAWGEQEVAWAVPPESAVTDNVHRSRSCDFSN